MRTEVRAKAMPTALVEEETTRFYGNDDDESGETSRLEQPPKATDSKSVKFQPRKANAPREKSLRTANPASHEASDWKSSRYEDSSTDEPQRLDEPAELQPIE